MRKLKLFFACLLMTVLSTGQMWGDSYTITFKSNSTSSDGTSQIQSSTTVSDYVSDGASYVSAISGSGKVFLGISGYGLKFGNSSNPGTVTLTLAEAVKPDSIVINASPWSATEGKGVLQDSVFNTTRTGAKGTFANFKYVYDGNTEVTTITLGTNSNGKRGYVKSVTVFYTSEAPSYTISAQSNDESKGTVSLTGSVITGSPKVNCRYASPAYTVTSGTATVTQSGNAFTVTPSSDCTVRINFEAIPQYTVTWDNNGDENTTTQVYEGEKPVFPATPAACDATSTTFIGWATAPWDGKLANLSGKTVYSSADAMPAVSAAVTYYAVFAKSSGSASDLFTWAGGSSSDLSSTTGVYSLNADGTDYAAAHAPYLVKWNGTGKNIVIEVTSQPGKVSAGFKMIGGASTSTITVQEADATDGTFTDVENLYISGAANDIVNLETTQAFKSTTRAIKLYYTKGSNVGLGPISIEGAVSYSDYLTTCAAPTCENLGKPSVTVTNKTYNSARLTWADVAHADKYLVKFNGVDQAATSNTYFDATDLDAATTYTYQVKALAEEGQDDWCDGEFTTEANFTTEPAPAATLTLSENGETHDFAGDHTLGETVTLPSADDCSKKFRGWSANEYCETEPELHAGDTYTLNATAQTLYAVYAKVMSVSDPSLTKLGSGATFADGDKLVIAAKGTKYAIYFENAGSSYVKNWEFAGDDPILTELTDSKKILTLVKSGDNWKFGDAINGYFYSSSSNNLEISTTNSSEFNSFVWNTTEEAFTITKTDNRYLNCRTDLTSTNANLWRFNGTNTNSGSPFLYVYKYSAGDATYGEWSTTCTAPLETPTFALDPEVTPVDGKYLETINVTISAAEGNIYYNINSADDPTSASTPYTGAITVDACGSTTIKAIAISSTNQSLVASATYVLNLPIPSVSAEDPYTEAEAIAVYDGGCYNNEDVWVTGTVQTATFYSSNTYTITLTNGFQFYYFYESYDGENLVPFSSDYIVAGDVLVAKGKLGKHNTTYQIANGYLVSRTPASSKESIVNDADHPYTVAQAIAFCNDPITYDLSESVYVQGVAAGAPNAQGTFNIYDEGAETTLFQLYKSDLGSFDAIKALDVVLAYGKIEKYNTTTYEMNQGAIVAVTPYVAPIVNVTSVELDETAISLKEGLSTTLVATVNPTEASNKNVTWESSNPAVATVDNGVVTAVAIGTTTITATTEDGGFTATCAVTVIDASARDLPNAAFKKVTATDQITDGKYLIVYAAAGVDTVAFDGALTTLDAVGNTIDVTIDGDYIVAPGDAAFTIDVTNHTLKSYSGKYIGRTANSNGMNQADDATLTNTFAIDGDGNAVITSSGNPTLRYNKASDQIRFRYYKSSQQDIQLYKMIEPEVIRGGLSDGKWGTICPKKTVMLPTGASFYTIAYVEKHGDEPYKVFYDEIAEGESLQAGHPYIFIAEGEEIKGVKVGEDATEGINDHGFIGKVEQYDFQVTSADVAAYKYYMVKDNNIRLCGEGWFRVGAERAYLDMSAGVNTVAHAPIAGRRRVCLTNDAPAVATGMDELNAAETPVKMIIDGQLFIIRGEKMYNVNGQLVK